MTETQKTVTGTVKLKLYKGNIINAGATSPFSLYDPEIATFDDFMKIRLIAAKVVACERVAKSDKLLKETLDVGGGATRTVCSGIAKYYTPEEMVGKTVVMVNNFAPRKMAGQVSEGMLLCAEDPDGRVRLLTVDGDVAPGSEIG